MENSSSTSKSPPKYPDCVCRQDARNRCCDTKKCLSLDGHYCICDIDIYVRYRSKGLPYQSLKNSDYCKAKNHRCICSSNRPSKCKSKKSHKCVCSKYGPLSCKSTKEHPCTCKDNWRLVRREKHIGHCKASEHPCFCKHNKSKCQACY